MKTQFVRPAPVARPTQSAAPCAARSLPTLLLAALALPAQQTTAPVAPMAASGSAVCTPIHTQPADQGASYGLWAAGRDYKVSFHDGMTFVPYLGASAEPPVTWRWTTTSATVGEQQLVTMAPRRTHGPTRAEFDLGGVVEAYDVLPEGLEQTFVLRQRPAVHGDLVIRGAIASVLRGEFGGSDGDVLFTDGAGRACLRYGAPTAIDAAGRQLPMHTRPCAGGLELVLPADALAAATFPLVVDPLLAPVALNAGAQIVDVALAYDNSGFKNLWFAEVRQTGTDTDLRLFRADEDGLFATLVFSDLTLSWSAREPSLGLNNTAGRCLMAWTRHIVASDTTRIRMHLHDRLDVTFDASVLNGPNINDRNQWRPVVGTERSPVSFTTLLVAFQVEGQGAFANLPFSEIYGTVIAIGASGSIGTTFPIAATALVDHERPSLSDVNIGPLHEWTIAYQRYSGFLDDWDIGVRRITSAHVVGPETLVDSAIAGSHEMAPHLGGTDDRLMLFSTVSTIAESSSKPANGNGHRIRGTRLDWNGAAFTFPHGSKTLQSDVDARLEIGGVVGNPQSDSHWALAFRSNVTQNVYLRLYGYRGDEIESNLIDSPTTALGTAVGGSVCFRPSGAEFYVGYGIDDPGVSSQSRVRRRQHPNTTAPFQSGSACTTTDLDWYGRQWIGTEGCGLQFTNAPAGSFTVVLLATASASLQLFGIGGVHDGCWLLVPTAGPDSLGMLPPDVGTTGAWQLSLPEGLAPFTLRAQAVTYDPASGEFFSSSRLNVPLVL